MIEIIPPLDSNTMDHGQNQWPFDTSFPHCWTGCVNDLQLGSQHETPSRLWIRCGLWSWGHWFYVADMAVEATESGRATDVSSWHPEPPQNLPGQSVEMSAGQPNTACKKTSSYPMFFISDFKTNARTICTSSAWNSSCKSLEDRLADFEPEVVSLQNRLQSKMSLNWIKMKIRIG